MFLFNLGDGIGKFIPEKFFLHKNYLIHGISFSFILFYSYFLYILTYKVEGIYSSPELRCFLIFISGLINGYNTNNFMNGSSSRFTLGMDKGKVGFYSVFFLLLGITTAGFINTTYLKS